SGYHRPLGHLSKWGSRRYFGRGRKQDHFFRLAVGKSAKSENRLFRPPYGGSGSGEGFDPGCFVAGWTRVARREFGSPEAQPVKALSVICGKVAHDRNPRNPCLLDLGPRGRDRGWC